MRRTLALLVLASSALGSAQVWEKHLAPGLTFYSEYDASIPRMINALHFDLHAVPTKMAPELAHLKVYNDDKSKGRSKVSEIVKETGAIAGVNASFFPYTGRPVGLMVRAGELISSPYAGRPEFGWGPNLSNGLAYSSFTGTFRVDAGQPVGIDSINDEAKPDAICLNTDTGAYAFSKGTAGTCVLIRLSGLPLEPTGHCEGEVSSVNPEVSKMQIPSGEVALMATGTKAPLLSALRPGQRIFVDVHTNGFNWSKVQHVVTGGPNLLKDGVAFVDAKEEGFNDDFALKRHPRTAIGRGVGGDIWIAVVDGRQPDSAGATLEEMAVIMKSLGCKDAINLDGGGSSTFDIAGNTVNRPSDNIEREVANAIVFVAPQEQRWSGDLRLSLPSLSVGGHAQLTLGTPDGKSIDNSEIVWAASGSAWIDQGGMLRGIKEGPATVTAWIHGSLVSRTLTVMPAAPPQ